MISDKTINNFKKFLKENGAIVLKETNPYEICRFKANGITSIIYEGRKGNSFVGEALEAFNKFTGKKNRNSSDSGLNLTNSPYASPFLRRLYGLLLIVS